MRILAKLVAWAFLLKAGQCVEITTEATTQVLETGTELILDCTLDLQENESYSANAPRWQKCQDLDYKARQDTDENYCWHDITHGEEIEGIFDLEFVDSEQTMARFLSSLHERSAPTKRLQAILTIRSLKVEDSGIYRCLVPGNIMLDHEINVISDLTSLSLITGEDASLTGERQTDADLVTFVQGKSGYMECLSIGGSPKPIVTATVGEEQRTGSMTTESTYTLDGEVEGLQVITHRVRLYNDQVKFDQHNDEQKLRCDAEVMKDGTAFHSLYHEATITMHFPPAFQNCSDVIYTMPERKNFEIKCRIFSRPPPSLVEYLYLETMNNPITAGEGAKGDFEAFSTLDPENSEVTIATLRIAEMKSEYFTGYQLSAKNDVGVIGRKVFDFEIKMGEESNIGGSTDKGVVLAPSIVLCLAMAIISLFR